MTGLIFVKQNVTLQLDILSKKNCFDL